MDEDYWLARALYPWLDDCSMEETEDIPIGYFDDASEGNDDSEDDDDGF